MAGSTSPRPPTPRGPDPWIAVGRLKFTVWDRWFLTLIVVAHHGDWQALRQALRAKRDAPGGLGQRDGEAKLSHLADLERRWARLDETARARLLFQCRDPHVLKRAQARVIQDNPDWSHLSPAMQNPPRKLLRERARRGCWPRFPVSPAEYEPLFARIGQAKTFFTERASFGLARRLDAALEKQLVRTTEPAHRTAVLRAFLTNFLATMDHADDSCGVLGDLARSEFPKYFTAPWREAGLSAELYYRDFLEFAVWEDYGLLYEGLRPFFKRIDKRDVDLVDGLICEIHDELSAVELEYQAAEALALRAELAATTRRFDSFEALAASVGSSQWRPAIILAGAAIAAGRRDLARRVFAAADQPGPHQEHLRAKARELLSERRERVSPLRRFSVVRTRK